MNGRTNVFETIFSGKNVGGDKLATEFGYQIPSDHTGECWAISAHPHGPATVEMANIRE